RGEGQQLMAEGCGDRRKDDQQGGDADTVRLMGPCSFWFAIWFAIGHVAIQGRVVLPARMRFSIRRRYVPPLASGHACVDRGGRALYGRGHPRWTPPGGDRSGHRR